MARSETSAGGVEVDETEAAAISAASKKVETARQAFTELERLHRLDPTASNGSATVTFLSKVWLRTMLRLLGSPACSLCCSPHCFQVRAAQLQLRRSKATVENVDDDRKRREGARIMARLAAAQGELVVVQAKLSQLQQDSGKHHVRGFHSALAKVEAATRLQKLVDPTNRALVEQFQSAVQVCTRALEGVVGYLG